MNKWRLFSHNRISINIVIKGLPDQAEPVIPAWAFALMALALLLFS